LKHIKKDIQDLVKQGVIDEITADRITEYYDLKQPNSINRILMVFGTLAASLIGMGIILIISHNWDNLGISLKTLIAFLPLLISQGLCLYSLKHKENSAVWRETCAALLFFSIGACMAMVSQIYNLQGEVSGFLILWMLLALPIVYLLPSSVVSLFYCIGITSAVENKSNDWALSIMEYPWPSLLLFAMCLPYYYHLMKKRQGSNSLILHHWVIAICGIIVLMKTDGFGGFHETMLSAMLIGGIYLGIGRLPIFDNFEKLPQAYNILGTAGTLILLFIAAFQFSWDITSVHLDMVKTSFLGLAALALMIWNLINRNGDRWSILPIVFGIYFLLVNVFNGNSTVAILIMNLLLLAIGIEYIFKGHRTDRFSQFNLGLVIISATIIARFLEWEVDFVIRGICFVVLGLLFFAANYFLVRKTQTNDTNR